MKDSPILAPLTSEAVAAEPLTPPSEWIKRKPFRVDMWAVSTFNRHERRFHCSLCNRTFCDGDVARWIYANGTGSFGSGNFFVCGDCDDTDTNVLSRAEKSFTDAIKLAEQWELIETKQ